MRQVLFYRSRGGGLICGYRWLPEGAPKAVVQIVHGVAEYAARYAHFAAFLNSQGILVVAQDHMGHGESISGAAPQGYFSGGWFAAVDDTYQLYLDTRKLYPGIPYVIFGHSMGSYITRSILARYPDSGIDAAVICGTGWMNPIAIRASRLTAEMVCLGNGERTPSPLLHKLMFGILNAGIRNPRTENDWLSRDEKQVDAYTADPLCGFAPTGGLVRDMMEGFAYVQRPDTLERMKKDLPVLFIAGGDDAVGDCGKGVERAAAEFRRSGMQRVSCKLYPGARHEILNEINKEAVYEDTVAWIKSVLSD
ncbi:MAG: alpha/beta hydrolase [Oscillospiraceae bacterium]|nr:alpha/beta hydrolase [Oscillospiraceae bacterium]